MQDVQVYPSRASIQGYWFLRTLQGMEKEKKMTQFVQRGDSFRVTSDRNLVVTSALPVGTYTVGFDQMSGEFFLRTIGGYSVGKLYGDVSSRADRILNTYTSREASTGVLLSGEKGTGKTLLAKLLSIKAGRLGFPTICINQPLSGEIFNQFVQSINQPCVVIFDEFEKMYSDPQSQESMLTLLDGVYPTRKLFILTTNDRWAVNKAMINRPGRLFYHLDYSGLSEEFIREYCEDNLDNKADVDGVIRISSIFKDFSFDMLKALVEEMNRYKETAHQAVKMMNIKIESYTRMYNLEILVNGVKPFKHDPTIEIDPMRNFGVWWYASEKKFKDGDDSSVPIAQSDIVSINNGNFVFKKKTETYPQDDIVVKLTKAETKAVEFF